MTDEVRVADAIKALTHRLNSWSVDEPMTRAQEFIEALIRQGWRPRALAVTNPTTPVRREPADAHIGQLRHLVAVATSGFCSHGVDPARCKELHPSEDEETENG